MSSPPIAIAAKFSINPCASSPRPDAASSSTSTTLPAVSKSTTHPPKYSAPPRQRRRSRLKGLAAPTAASTSNAGRLILHQELRSREGSQARTGRILRAIGLGGQILSDLGIQRIRLLSNTPMHIPALEGFGLEIVEQVAVPVEECSRVG